MLDDDDDDGELEIYDPLEVIMEGSDEEFSDLEEFDDNEHLMVNQILNQIKNYTNILFY